MSFIDVADAPGHGGLFRVRYPSTGPLSRLSRAWTGVRQVVRLEMSYDEVVVKDDEHVPAWVHPLVAQLVRLERLPQNWDSYGALPLQVEHRNATLWFLGLVMGDDIQLPDVVPLADGGVQLEWRSDEVDVDFISDDENPYPMLYVTEAGETRVFQGDDAVSEFLSNVRETFRLTEPCAA